MTQATHDQIAEAIQAAFAPAAKIAEITAKRQLTTVEVSLLYSIGVSTLEKLRLEGRGPRYVKEGKSVTYRVEDLESYFKGSLVGTIDQPSPDASR